MQDDLIIRESGVDAMKLAKDELEMLEGRQGSARQKAMELLVKYGTGLGAERFADTNNVTINLGVGPSAEVYRKVVPSMDIDELASKFFLSSEERVVVDKLKAFTTTNAYFRDYAYPDMQQGGKELSDIVYKIEKYCERIGAVTTDTCVPYQCGNIPMKGEVCAWSESSAIAYCNSVLGGRTNIEGFQSGFASAVTGKTPLAGMLLDENRKGSVIVNVEVEMNSVQDWSLLGYFTGPQVGLEVPVYSNFKNTPDFYQVMSLCAAGIASGSIVMFHLLGVTPEAATLEMATAGKKGQDLRVVNYGVAERQKTYEFLNHAKADKVDIVALGCPHYSLTRLTTLSRLLEGKKVHTNTALYVFTGRMQKAMADRMGLSEIIEKAGGIILEDSCAQILDLDPSDILASDSAKLVHYVPGTTGVKSTWFGTMEECVEAAITGKWAGGML